MMPPMDILEEMDKAEYKLVKLRQLKLHKERHFAIASELFTKKVVYSLGGYKDLNLVISDSIKAASKFLMAWEKEMQEESGE